MSRFDRSIWFERLVALRDGYGQWADDTESVISIADVIAYADAVMAAAELADEPGLGEAGETATASWPDGTPVETRDAHRSVSGSRPGSAARDSADGRPRHRRFFLLPNDHDGSTLA